MSNKTQIKIILSFFWFQVACDKIYGVIIPLHPVQNKLGYMYNGRQDMEIIALDI